MTITGIQEFLARSAPYMYGEGVPAVSTWEIITGGRMVEESQVISDPSVGIYWPVELREALVTCYGSVDVELQNKNFLTLAVRQDDVAPEKWGRLKEFKLAGGNDVESQYHNQCKVDTMTIDLVAGQKARASMSWKGLYSTVAAGGVEIPPSSDPTFMWYEGAFAASDLAGMELIRANININHNTDWVPVIDNTLTPKRMAKYLVERAQVITATLTFLQQEAIDLTASVLDYIASVTLTLTSSAHTATITLDNLKRGTHERPLVPYELVEHTAAYTVQKWSIA